uniref:ADP-ribosylation factor-like protein 13B n=2 Tax=Lygus hesperus TaxID=30085 RepID=A0A0A9XY23_LYGHE
MGNACCNHCTSFGTSPVQRKIILLLVGLDNSGKTTAAKGLTGEIVEHTIPTIGFSSIKMKHKGFDVIIYDLGGGPQIRGIWSCYFSDVFGVIFVVDASDENRLGEAKVLLYNLLTNEKLAGKPLLVLANKQDIPNALDEIDIVESLSLEPLVNQQKCVTLVEVCSALSPDNNEKVDSRLIRGYRWLVRQVISNYDELNRRVERDMKEAHAAVLVQREEWKKRRSIESDNKQTAVTNSVHKTNGSLPPVAETNGYAHSPKFSHRIKHQLDMDRHKNKKSNKVFPGVMKDEQTTEERTNSPPLRDGGSMTVRALTSPPRRSQGQSEMFGHKSRPFTSKSLGSSEVKTWGLEEELTLVDNSRAHQVNSPVEDHVEYLTNGTAF